MTDKTTEIEAAVFRRLLDHLDAHKEVQNIELMNLADFCRNCLAKWYAAEAEQRGEKCDYESAREIVYGMPYSEWKEQHQSLRPRSKWPYLRPSKNSEPGRTKACRICRTAIPARREINIMACMLTSTS